MKPRIVYKALKRDGTSPYQKAPWPLPPDKKTPGEWVEIEGSPVLCERGLHGYHSCTVAERVGDVVYEMEVAGEIVEDGEKLAATRARLLRVVAEPLPEGPVEMGLENCLTCGKPHGAYIHERGRAPHWGDLVDGHPYRREPAEAVAARLLADRDRFEKVLRDALECLREGPSKRPRVDTARERIAKALAQGRPA